MGLSLPIGCVFANWSSGRLHHDYYDPPTGYYHGFLQARFLEVRPPVFSFSITGESTPQWHWSRPSNFAYQELHLEWSGLASNGTARLALPSFRYASPSQSGLLTQPLLRSWLVQSTHAGEAEATRQVDALWELLNQASVGALPPPRHHHHTITSPQGTIAHFLVGFGVYRLVYVWMAVWFVLTFAAVRHRSFRMILPFTAGRDWPNPYAAANTLRSHALCSNPPPLFLPTGRGRACSASR